MSRPSRHFTCRVLTRLLYCLGLVGLLCTVLGNQARAQTTSAACAAVNSGAFNLTTALGPLSSSILTAWNVGDTIKLTFSSFDGASRSDGLYHGPDFTVAKFGSLSLVTVPATGTIALTYTVTASDLTNGIAVDPEANDSVSATCTPEPLPTVTNVNPSQGPTAGGTSVTLTGMNFGGASGVTFGGNAATNVTVVSATSITATTPAHAAGAVDVVVTTGAGSFTASSAFNYIAPPAVTGISPNFGPAVGGTVVTVNGSGFTGATSVRFGGLAGSFTLTSDTQITATSPAGTGIVDLTVTTPIGTSATSAADRFIYRGPPVITSVSPNKGTPGGGTGVTIAGGNFTGATAVRFGAATASFAINSDTQITATSPSGTGIVDVTVVNAAGTSATNSADQFDYGVPRTFVSASGSDSNTAVNCARTAPCRTLAMALTVTLSGGEIVALDPAGFGPITISGPLSLVGIPGAAINAPANGIGVAINAGISDTVEINDFQITSDGVSNATGIAVNSGNLVLRNSALKFLATGLTVTNTKASLFNVDIIGNATGIAASGTGPNITNNTATGPTEVLLFLGSASNNATAYFMQDPGTNTPNILVFLANNGGYSTGMTGNGTLVDGSGAGCPCSSLGTFTGNTNPN